MKPLVRKYRYGTIGDTRGSLRIGATRYLPRGVRREDWPALYFDMRLPLVAPSTDLLACYRRGEMTFAVFGRRYKREMTSPESRQVIRLLAELARVRPINIGCFCEDEMRCHRSILRALILEEIVGR